MHVTERMEKVNIDRLVPYARNARTHSKEQILQLRSSIREFGFVNPVIVDKALNVIAGHGRILAAKEEGMTEVPCVFVEHLTVAQRRAYILADNRLALNAGWDDELLALELGDLKDEGFDLSLTGFSDDELARLVIDAEETGMPNLASGDREPLQQMAFMLHDDQAETVRAALDVAKQMGAFVDTGNENSNGNALARVCELFLGQHGNS